MQPSSRPSFVSSRPRVPQQLSQNYSSNNDLSAQILRLLQSSCVWPRERQWRQQECFQVLRSRTKISIIPQAPRKTLMMVHAKIKRCMMSMFAQECRESCNGWFMAWRQRGRGFSD
ncbi:hypothetical protein BC567DRAFT_223000 [Phyllosticta citribraziliensis]